MIIYEGGHGANYTTEKLIVATLKCDKKEEIKDNLNEMIIVGWPEGYGLAMDSTAVSMKLEVGKYNSEGHWNW